MSVRGGKCVLVVDDERVIADTLALILNRGGYNAHTAYSAEEAIDLAASLNPDVLISDVIMGGMSGIELAIYVSNYLPACRIVLISGHVLTPGLLELAENKGYQFEMLPKPIGPHVLLNHLLTPGIRRNQRSTSS